MSADPFFIVGNRRSGTTMLRLMLSGHPSLGVPPESGFAVCLGWRYGAGLDSPKAATQFVDDFFRLPEAVDWDLDAGELRERLAGAVPCSFAHAVDIVYRAYLEKRFPGKARWGDKTTGYEAHTDELATRFPNATFVHLVRDGRGVLASFREVPHLPKDARAVALEWRHTVNGLGALGRRLGPVRWYTLRYEDLVTNPPAELMRLCAFLGETYAPAMLDFGAANRAQGLEPARHMGWKGKTLDAVDPTTATRWREQLAPTDTATFETLAGDTLARFGYADVAPTPNLRGLASRAVFDAHVELRAALRPWKHRLRRHQP